MADKDTKNQELTDENQATEEPTDDKAEGAKVDEASQLSEPGEISSESTSTDVHEPDRAGSDDKSEGELEKQVQPSDQSKIVDEPSGASRPDEPSTTPAETPKKKADKPISKELEKIIEQIEKLSVLELADLVHALEERFGVTATPMAIGGQTMSGTPTGAAEPQEEQTTFNVILASSGANKIGAIKAVRELVPTLGLKEAKDLVEAAPKPVLEGVNKETANEAKTKLTAAGATVELQ